MRFAVLSALLLLCVPSYAFYEKSTSDGPSCPFSAPFSLNLSHGAILQDSEVQQAIVWSLNHAKAVFANTSSLTGLGFSIGTRSGPLVMEGLGLTNATDPASPTVDAHTSLFRIGSQTKILTTLTLFILRDLGAVSMDDPVTRFVPDFRPNAPNTVPSLRDLATFRADIPREACVETSPGVAACGFGVGTNATNILGTTGSAPAVFPTGWSPVYSNYGIALLGHALDVAAQRTAPPTGEPAYSSAADVFARVIAAPLGLNCTGFEVTPAAAKAMVAADPAIPGSAYFRTANVGWTAYAGQAYSCAADAPAFQGFLLRAFADQPAPGDPSLPRAASVRDYLRAVTPLADGLSGFGHAWASFLSGPSRRRLVLKGGALPGYLSMQALAPNEGAAVQVLGAGQFDASTIAIPVVNRIASALRSLETRTAAALYGGQYTLQTGSLVGFGRRKHGLGDLTADPVFLPTLSAEPPTAADESKTLTVAVEAGILEVFHSNTNLTLIPAGTQHTFRATPAAYDCYTAAATWDSLAGRGNGLFGLYGTDLIVFEPGADGTIAAMSIPSRQARFVKTA